MFLPDGDNTPRRDVADEGPEMSPQQSSRQGREAAVQVEEDLWVWHPDAELLEIQALEARDEASWAPGRGAPDAATTASVAPGHWHWHPDAELLWIQRIEDSDDNEKEEEEEEYDELMETALCRRQATDGQVAAAELLRTERVDEPEEGRAAIQTTICCEEAATTADDVEEADIAATAVDQLQTAPPDATEDHWHWPSITEAHAIRTVYRTNFRRRGTGAVVTAASGTVVENDYWMGV